MLDTDATLSGCGTDETRFPMTSFGKASTEPNPAALLMQIQLFGSNYPKRKKRKSGKLKKQALKTLKSYTRKIIEVKTSDSCVARKATA